MKCVCVAGLCALAACSHDAGSVSQSRSDRAPPAPAGMVWIPGGEFTMGSTEGLADERPPHRVRVSGFFIDATELTNA